MMFNQKVCEKCGRKATIESIGKFYCGEHALELVKLTNPIPPVKMISPR